MAENARIVRWTPEWEAEMERAMLLQRRLHAGGVSASKDALSLYRMWLDENHIPAEDADGWPTEQAYNEANVAAFLAAREG